MSVATHASSDQEEIQVAKQTIAYILSRRPGKQNAISSKELADRTPIKATTVRDVIPEIIQEYRLPIGSSPDGYYRIDDDDEFVSVMHRYESQREQARSRMQWLAQAYYGKQEVHL